MSCKQTHNLEPPVRKVFDIIYGPPRIKFLFTYSIMSVLVLLELFI